MREHSPLVQSWGWRPARRTTHLGTKESLLTIKHKLSNIMLEVADHVSAHPDLYYRTMGSVSYDESAPALVVSGSAGFSLEYCSSGPNGTIEPARTSTGIVSYGAGASIVCPPASAAPGHVRRAEEYILAHAAEPLTLADIVAAAGVPARATRRPRHRVWCGLFPGPPRAGADQYRGARSGCGRWHHL